MSEIGAALSSVNATIAILKGLTALTRRYAEAELRGKVVDALEQATEARAAVGPDAAGAEQRPTSEARRARHDGDEAYWQKREGQRDDGPFCATCWGSDEKQMRLHPTQSGLLQCKRCSHTFGDKSSARPPKKAKGSLSDFWGSGT